MKLKKLEHLEGYRFKLEFVDGKIKDVDLTDLIVKYVSLGACRTSASPHGFFGKIAA